METRKSEDLKSPFPGENPHTLQQHYNSRVRQNPTGHVAG